MRIVLDTNVLVAVTLPDPDDLPLLEVAVAGHADALVTGNTRHFVPVEESHGVNVVTPTEAVRALARSGRPTGS